MESNEKLFNHIRTYMSTQSVGQRKRAPKGYVTLANGRFAKKEDVVEINNFKYNKNSEEVFMWNDSYFHISDSRFGLDEHLNKRVPISHLKTGIVGINTDKTLIVKRSSVFKPGGVVYNGYPVLNSKLLTEAGLVEDLWGNFHDKPERAAVKNQEYLNKLPKVEYNKFTKNPLLEDKKSLSVMDKIEFGMSSPTYKATGNLKYSFGVEIETSGGRIPMYKVTENKLNMIAEYDGSLRDPDDNHVYGGEYVTGVLRGDAGLIQVNKITSTLKTYCSINKKCSVHVHIGGGKFDKKFIVASYIFGQKIENELFKMMPHSRRNSEYCKKMGNIDLMKFFYDYEEEEAIDIAYGALYKRFLMGKKPKTAVGDRSVNHPGGRTCNHDKNSDRYCWLNLIPTTFNTREVGGKDIPHTIEFRAHSATLNYGKIKNWILICMAMTNFIEDKFHTILSDKITLEQVIKHAYGEDSKLTKTLVEYVKSRKELFSSASNEPIEYLKESDSFVESTPKSKKEILCV